jgi:ABC-type sugar transport system ATPase subunit
LNKTIKDKDIMSVEPDYILEAKGISKKFGGVQALTDVSLKLYRGEVHAVIGENGAGKTTLMNIIGGIIKQDKGALMLNGEKVEFSSPLEAFKKGIATIHQELTMMPHLNVMENIFMGRMQKLKISRNGFINRTTLLNSAMEALNLISLSIDPESLVKDISISERQGIEIIKALSGDAGIIIMDEPNSSLTDVETKQLFSIIDKLTSRGVSVVYVSHKIDEVLQIADRITVLRDGRCVDTLDKKDATVNDLFNMIAGRDMKEFQPRNTHVSDHVLLRVNGLCGNGFHNISFDLLKGEILGFYGLVGSGRSELGRAIFGADSIEKGTVFLDDKPFFADSPASAIKNGIVMVPEDRKEQALFMNLPVISNMTISHLPELSNFNFYIRSSAEDKLINDYIRLLNIKIGDPAQPINTLSGGNQQKVVLARNLMIKPGIIILDEPTHGIDVGAREEIYQLIGRLAEEGIGIIFISSEIPEIMSVSDRIAVLHEGQLAGILSREEATEKKLIAFATGYSLQLAE